MGSTLHIVDFLIQNMTAQGLNKQTNPPGPADMSGKNTALHLCALHDRRECMKLLLRSGSDYEIKNSQNRTALDIAKEMGHESCKELVSVLIWPLLPTCYFKSNVSIHQIEHAIKREKSAFDHINTDWNIHDDGSTDFSDDDTVLMDERKSRSRPPSFVGGDSPVALRSRSSTCDSIQSGSSPSSSCNPNLVGAQQIPGGGSSQQRQIPIPSSGTSPKQYAGGFASHYGSGAGSAAGGSSPNSSSSSSIIRQASAQISAAAAAAAVSAQSKKSSSGRFINEYDLPMLTN